MENTHCGTTGQSTFPLDPIYPNTRIISLHTVAPSSLQAPRKLNHDNANCWTKGQRCILFHRLLHVRYSAGWHLFVSWTVSDLPPAANQNSKMFEPMAAQTACKNSVFRAINWRNTWNNAWTEKKKQAGTCWPQPLLQNALLGPVACLDAM